MGIVLRFDYGLATHKKTYAKVAKRVFMAYLGENKLAELTEPTEVCCYMADFSCKMYNYY